MASTSTFGTRRLEYSFCSSGWEAPPKMLDWPSDPCIGLLSSSASSEVAVVVAALLEIGENAIAGRITMDRREAVVKRVSR